MAFDGKAFGDEMVKIVKTYVDREVGALRNEVIVTQRALFDARQETAALLDLLSEHAAPAAKAAIDERGM